MRFSFLASSWTDITYYAIASFGIGCLLAGGVYTDLLATKDPLLQKQILRTKLWVTALCSHLFAHGAFVYDLKGINKTACVLLGGVAFVNFVWAVKENGKFSTILESQVTRTKPTTMQVLTLVVDLVFTGLWGISLMWNPRGFEPAAGHPLSFAKAGNGTFTDAQTFAVRMEGVTFMAFALCMLELLFYDRSVEAVRANIKLSFIAMALYSLHMVRVALWCENADPTKIAVDLLSNVGLAGLFLECGPSVFEEDPAKVLAAHTKKALHPAKLVPVAETKANKAH